MSESIPEQLGLPLGNEGSWTRQRPKALCTVTTYLLKPMRQPQQLIDECAAFMSTSNCDTLVGRGLSGAIAVSVLGPHFGKHWAVVRKPKDGTHSSFAVEGEIGERWLFVDDLICTGQTLTKTIKAVVASVANHNCGCEPARHHKTEFVGCWLYHEGKDGLFIPAAKCDRYMPVVESLQPNQEETGPITFEVCKSWGDQNNRYYDLT